MESRLGNGNFKPSQRKKLYEEIYAFYQECESKAETARKYDIARNNVTYIIKRVEGEYNA